MQGPEARRGLELQDWLRAARMTAALRTGPCRWSVRATSDVPLTFHRAPFCALDAADRDAEPDVLSRKCARNVRSTGTALSVQESTRHATRWLRLSPSAILRMALVIGHNHKEPSLK